MGDILYTTADKRGVATVTLNRPEVHNAFNQDLVAALSDAFTGIGADGAVRVVVLAAQGASFSAGADLNWMRAMANASEGDNRADALRLARMYRIINELPKPLIGRINGAAFGGGVGLVACCDIAIGAEDAKFGLTEVKLGLVPATIAPYVLNAIGPRQARRLFVSGEIIDAAQARRAGLLHETAPAGRLDDAVEKQIGLLLKNGPAAMMEAKQVVRTLSAGRAREEADALMAELIARLRVSAEGQEGLGAFLEKRNPDWRA